MTEMVLVTKDLSDAVIDEHLAHLRRKGDDASCMVIEYLRARASPSAPVGEGVREKVANLPTYRPVVEGGCECCGTWAEMEPSDYGEWICRADVLALLSPGDAG